MKKLIMLFFISIATAGFSYAQVTQDEGQPRDNRQQSEQAEEEEMEQTAPAQQPGQMEQEDERAPEPGVPQAMEEEGEIGEDDAEGFDTEGEQVEPQQGSPEFLDRFANAEPVNKKDVPEMVMSSFREGYFSEWEVVEIYNAEDVETDIELPAQYVIKVKSQDETMHLYYTSNGELLMQEKGSLVEKVSDVRG
jgi:hypothetical protein